MEDEKEDFSNIKVELPGITIRRKVPKRKIEYGLKLRNILQNFNTCLVVGVTNVGSRQIADLRKSLRGRAQFLFGKNTMIRKVIRDYVKETGNPKWMKLMDICTGNSGFCFIKPNDIAEMRKILLAEKKQCAAKSGTVAPVDVWVPAGPTGMEPTQTGFFQAMDIPTRINRGQIDITDPVHIIKKNTKVGASQASLLIKLGIKPFWYGLEVFTVYEDGVIYDASVLDITPDDICNCVFNGLRQIAALSFSLDYPSIATVPHTLLNAYKKALALGLSCEKYSWDNLKTVKEILENPDAFKAAAAPTGGAAAPTGAPAQPKEATPEKESDAAPTNMFGGAAEESSEEEEEDSESDD